jgi:hypothetical protein
MVSAQPESVLQRLHDSEINVELSSFYDCGFWWKLGDEMNGYVAEGHASTPDEAVARIVRAAIQHYPNSHFARSALANVP